MSNGSTYLDFYEKVEDSIVEQLAALEDSQIQVMPLPESPDEMNRPFKSGLVTVGYTKSNFGTRHGSQVGDTRGPLDIGDAVQQEELIIEVSAQSRIRRGRPDQVSSLRIARMVRGLLLGFKPHGCDKLYMKEQGFSDFDGQAWEYSLVFACHTYVVPMDEQDIMGHLEQADFELEIATLIDEYKPAQSILQFIDDGYLIDGITGEEIPDTAVRGEHPSEIFYDVYAYGNTRIAGDSVQHLKYRGREWPVKTVDFEVTNN